LDVPECIADKRGEVLKALIELSAEGGPFDQRLWLVKRKDFATSRVRVTGVGEAGLYAGGLVRERERAVLGRQRGGEALDILAGLGFDTGESVAGGFGFDDPDAFAICVEHVISLITALEREFEDGDAEGRRRVGLATILNHPPAGAEELVDFCSGKSFWSINHYLTDP
jgi:hypothetical protein